MNLQTDIHGNLPADIDEIDLWSDGLDLYVSTKECDGRWSLGVVGSLDDDDVTLAELMEAHDATKPDAPWSITPAAAYFAPARKLSIEL